MAQPQKTAGQIITDFELQVNDITELSSTEELALLNRLYIKICNAQPWEWLKKNVTGTILSDANGYYITAPSDFAAFAQNNNYTDNSIESQNNASPKVIFIVNGSAYMPYQIINWSDRRQYINRLGFAYYEPSSGQIRFTGTPQFLTYDFDYVRVPALLTTSDYPVFPGQFHDILTFAMATDNDILQLSPKASSYAADNNAKYDQYFLDLQYANANLILN